MRVWGLALVTLAALAVAAPARAQAPARVDDRPLEIDDCPPPPQVDPARLQQLGFEHFQRGEVLYVQGDYRGAVKELVAAYCIRPFYTILKDIGQAYERELEYERAIAYLERYVADVPTDAQKIGQCGVDPQEDRLNVIARVKSLRALRAKILINTDPSDATITLSNETGIKGRGVSGEALEVLGGSYRVQIDRKGFHSETQEVHAEIGKPYTYFRKLDPRRGRLRVRVVPANARLFLDQKQVGTGAYETELPGGRYTLSAEASGHLTVAQDIELLADRDTPVSLELPPEPQVGRRQFIGYATIAGGVAGGGLAGVSSEPAVIAVGTTIGFGAGFFGSYFVTPRDIPLGTSSLTITSSMIGGVLVGTTSLLITEDGNRIAPAIGGGLILGGVSGYYIGTRTKISPGDAAVINSGALWGTVIGALFSTSFEAESQIRAGLVLSGLGMGTLAGVLATRYFNVSRTRAALIDLGGIVGVLVGAAIQNVVVQAGNSAAETEQTANYTLGGLASGLFLAGILTRNIDMPKLTMTPVVSKTQAGGTTSTTLGFSGTF